ncbi:peptidoglycan-binding protein [Streptomyces indicus]|uniref:Putative peptidoglycan binding domain-containing protein n=1 Tax=Streptomyces indicus TaxID=417292 RepID=A0A1G9AXK9_9ACTN|nr:peptidoglycan-binding protein [Streptomyces indicus]SDK31604.1 Putative peptidoglycan binding domain-containing protein [Streptomyces indicus]
MEKTKRRRGPLWIGIGVVLVATASGVGALGLGGGGGGEGEAAAQQRTGRTVAVTRATLTDQAELEGNLGHGPEVPFLVKAAGTVTWLPETGTEVKRGQAVLRVDDKPVVLMYGALPVYRELGVVPPRETRGADGDTRSDGGDTDTGGTEASGTAEGGTEAGGSTGAPAGRQAPATPLRGMDVKQFESNLAALGYTGFTVDDTYSELTARAVKEWQEDLGLPRTGRVGVGDILYAPGAVRISGSSVRVGAEAAGTPVSYTSTKRMVTVAASAAETGWARRGTAVHVELPDGRTVRGEVGAVGKDATAPDGGGGEASGGAEEGGGKSAAEVSVTITFAAQKELGRLQSGPVTVRYVVKEREKVLAVPVAALVALAEGGYGLERADGRGFVAVETGLFAGGKVEVSGPGVREGMKVRIPE